MTDARCRRCTERKVGLRDIIKAGLGDRYQVLYSFLPAIKISKCFMYSPYHDWFGQVRFTFIHQQLLKNQFFTQKLKNLFAYGEYVNSKLCFFKQMEVFDIFRRCSLQKVEVYAQIFRLLTAARILHCSRFRQKGQKVKLHYCYYKYPGELYSFKYWELMQAWLYFT